MHFQRSNYWKEIFQAILDKTFEVLFKFSFITIETELKYSHHKVYAGVASGVSKLLKTKVRTLANLKISRKSLNFLNLSTTFFPLSKMFWGNTLSFLTQPRPLELTSFLWVWLLQKTHSVLMLIFKKTKNVLYLKIRFKKYLHLILQCLHCPAMLIDRWFTEWGLSISTYINVNAK